MLEVSNHDLNVDLYFYITPGKFPSVEMSSIGKLIYVRIAKATDQIVTLKYDYNLECLKLAFEAFYNACKDIEDSSGKSI